MDSASTTAWVRLEVTWENLLCVLPPSSTTSVHSEQSLGFMPIILRIVFDSTSSIRLLEIEWSNQVICVGTAFYSQQTFLPVPLSTFFIRIIDGGTTTDTTTLFWRKLLLQPLYHRMNRNKESLIFVPPTVWCLCLCWIHSHLIETSTHPLCVIYHWERMHLQSSGGTILNRLECICWSCRVN